MTRSSSCLALALIALVSATLFFELTDVDMQIQRLFYNESTGQWWIDKTDGALRFVFYDGIKAVLLALAAALLVAASLFGRKPKVREYRSRLWLALLSIALILATSSGLKALTNVACPGQLSVFGGTIPHVKLFGAYPAGQRPSKAQQCYPAGHASGGFALLSLALLFKTPRNRRRVITAAITLGWVMGSYKMLIGDHFLSHTLTSMLLAICIVCAISYLVTRQPHQTHQTQASLGG